MRLTKISTAGLLSAVAMASSLREEVDCSSGSVFIFNGGNNLEAKVKQQHNLPFNLNMDQTQLVLADLAGTSQFETVKNSEDAGVVEEVRSKHKIHDALLSTDKPHSTIVVVVEDLPKSDRKGLLGQSPAFTVNKFAGSKHFTSLIDKWAHDVEKLYGKVSHFFAESGYLLTSKRIDGLEGNEKRELANIPGLDETIKSERAVLEDVKTLRLIAELMVGHRDKAFIRLKSLSGLIDEDEKYKISVEAIESALSDLIATSVTFKVAIVAPPSSICEKNGGKETHRKHHNKEQKHSTDHGKHHHKEKTTHSHHALLSRDLPIAPAKDVRLAYSATGFNTEEKCELSTNNCSGHGSCIKTSYGTFVCACKPSYDSDKKKTTRWGGNACQKKDVSIEFQLFFWTGLGIVLTISWAIGVLFSIGSEPLPGILGVAKKSS